MKGRWGDIGGLRRSAGCLECSEGLKSTFGFERLCMQDACVFISSDVVVLKAGHQSDLFLVLFCLLVMASLVEHVARNFLSFH